MSDTCQRDSSLAEEIHDLRVNANRVKSEKDKKEEIQRDKKEADRKAGMKVVEDEWFSAILAAIKSASKCGKRNVSVTCNAASEFDSEVDCNRIAHRVQQRLAPYNVICNYYSEYTYRRWHARGYHIEKMRFRVTY